MSKARTYGRLWLDDGKWKLQCEPHVAMFAKRIFHRIPRGQVGVLEMKNTPAVCRDLVWLMQRFALEVDQPAELKKGSKSHVDRIKRLDQIVDANYKPRSFEMAVAPREYQTRAAELYLAGGSLLLADEVGLGKTCSAICSLMDPATLPAVVVSLTHLPQQWQREIGRFAPDLKTHVIQAATPYELTKVDVIIINYHKLAKWAEVLAYYCRSAIFDEIQELRSGQETLKWLAAKHIADAADFRIGLSATPIYNYGGEIFNLLEVLSPGSLGTFDEFALEWCEAAMDRKKARLKDPDAFGAWLKESHLMLRRTRRDVGRELPPLQTITHEVDCDEAELKKIEGKAGELAQIILSESAGARGQKMHASEEFTNVLRQATGIAKAPYVAEFVRMLLESGEPVVLYGWHRAVYEIWLEKLKDFRPSLFTGSESAGQKEESARRFISGDTDLMIVSLRSGAGLDGLQYRCRTVVFGELDWSPGVHEQCIGRVARDGQTDPVAAYFLLAEDGADPFIAGTLGLKRDQVEGIRGRDGVGPQRNDSAAALRSLARQYLEKRAV